jgi:uncharacterized membrane protein YcaP (DUF421 family)
MRRELITLDELRSQARLQGVEDLGGIKQARLESDGQISIVAEEGRGNRGTPRAKG